MHEPQAETSTLPNCKYSDGYMTGAFSTNGHFCGVEQFYVTCVSQPFHRCRLRRPKPARVTAGVADQA